MQRRRAGVGDVANRREPPVAFRLGVDRAEVAVKDGADVGGALERDPVGDARAGDRRLEAVGVRDGPVGQEAAAATSRRPPTDRIGDAVRDEFVDAADDVEPVGLAITLDDALQELGAAPGAAARVGHEDGVAALGHELAPVVPVGVQVVRPGAGRSAVDLRQERVARALLVTDRQDQQPLDLPAVRRGPFQLARLAKLIVACPGIEVSQLARRLRAVERVT